MGGPEDAHAIGLPFGGAVEAQVRHARRQQRQRLLQFGAGEGLAEAVVDAGTERELRLVALVGSDVEHSRLVEDVRVAVGFGQPHGDERARGEQDVAVLDVDAGEPGSAAHGAEVTHRLLDGPVCQLGPLGEERPLVGVLREQPERTPQLVAGGIGASDDDRVDHHHQLVVVQLVAGLFGGDEIGEQVVGRLTAPLGDQLARVGIQLVLGTHDQVELARHVDREDLQDVVRPAAEQLPVVLGRTEQLADDGNGVRLADVDRDIGFACGRHLVDQTVDHLAHERAQTIGLAG